MRTYVIRLISYLSTDHHIVNKVLQYPMMSRLVLPATVSDLSMTTQYQIETAADFRVLPIFIDDGTLFCDLVGSSGIKMGFTIAKSSRMHHNVHLVFTMEHWQTGLVSYDILKALLHELIPVLQAEHADIYDRAIALKREPLYFRDDKMRQYPVGLGWFTYFGKGLVEFLHSERFDALHTFAEKYVYNEGLMITLQKELFDEHDAAHRARREQAEHELNLENLLPRDLYS